MKRPTVADLARESGVSVTTIDRVLNGRDRVRPVTAQRVLDAAERIGFYASGVIRARIAGPKPVVQAGILLPFRDTQFIENLAHQLRAAASAYDAAKVNLSIDYVDDMEPEAVAAKIEALGKKSTVIGVVAARHPQVSRAIERQRERGVATLALISELQAECSIGYVGVDHWKVGRTAAWAFANVCPSAGKIGMIIGNHRFRSHEVNEMGFRSYFRDHETDFEILEPLSSWVDNARSEQLVTQLLRDQTDLAGLYMSGGGIAGALAALRRTQRGARLVTVGHQLTTETREALIDGTLNLVIANPVRSLARETITALVSTMGRDPELALPSVTLPIEIFTPENV